MELLNAFENALLFYGRKHPIGNPYQYFADKLGYKARNYFYFIFQKRQHYRLTVDDVKRVYEITKDEQLKTTWNNYLGAN